MKKLLAIMISSMILGGFTGYGMSGPRDDSMLNWFDVTEYMGELVDYCYGDGYVNYVNGDPGYCPPYTLSTLNAKLETYMTKLGLTFVKYLGRSYVATAIESLRADYMEGVTDSEVLSRVMNVQLVTCLVLDGEGKEKIVYLPSYVPKGSTMTFFIYDLVFGVTYAELAAMIAENADACIVRILSLNVGGTTVDARYCLSVGLLDDLRLWGTDGSIDDEIQFIAFIDTYVMENGIWTKVDNVHILAQCVYLRCTDDGMTVSYNTYQYDQDGNPAYELLFTIPYPADPDV
ncbi:MAG TPA: hypothetical protein DCR44_07925 [Acholeplasmatales bacterium]|nr:MAG: hypothetical protein A2Y16_00170 [Tenericutes bacterium GWF2_57_13]HAQ57303.1 hypothetical protein [Acholeplasmatales bacterium]